MIEIGLGVTLFTAIVVVLSMVILAARAVLTPSVGVVVTVNDRLRLTVAAGDKLLGALADAGIRLPSACGGKGTCGMCRVEVVTGGAAPLPVETARLSRRDIALGARLACQVTVREELAVRVAEDIFGVETIRCRVRANDNVATLIKELALELPAGQENDFPAGSFLQITCPPYRARFADFDIAPAFRDVWDELGLWRYVAEARAPVTRAYSLASCPGEEHLMLNVRIALPPPGAPPETPPGVVSSYLFSLRPGDTIELAGPYGHFFIKDDAREIVLVGGGAGMAPLRAHILDQLERRKTSRKISFWYGARSRRELFYGELFERLAAEHDNFSWLPALSEPRPEDDWRGATGFIHQVVHDRYLADHPAPEACAYYLCGPPLMIKAVRHMLDGLGVEEESILYDDFGG